MKDIKMLFDVNFKPALKALKIIFITYLSTTLFSFLTYVLRHDIQKDSIIIKVMLFTCIGMLSIWVDIFPYDQLSLSALPLKKIRLYPLICPIFYIIISMPFLIILWLFQIYIGENPSFNYLLLISCFLIFVSIYKMTITKKFHLAGYLTVFILLQNFIFYCVYFNSNFKSFVWKIFYIEIFIIIVLNLFNHKKGNLKHNLNFIQKYIHLDFNIKSTYSRKNIISHCKWTSFSILQILVILLCIAYIPFHKLSYFLTGNNLKLAFIAIALSAFYENSLFIMAVFGLPITPKEIYTNSLKTRLKIIIFSIVIVLLCDLIIYKTLYWNVYVLNLIAILVPTLITEITYSSFRAKNMPFFAMLIFIFASLTNISNSLSVTNIFILVGLIIGNFIIIKDNLKIINTNPTDLIYINPDM